MEHCSCGAEATHKVEENTPDLFRHPFTTYLCCKCFGKLMGPVAKKWCANGHRLADAVGMYLSVTSS